LTRTGLKRDFTDVSALYRPITYRSVSQSVSLLTIIIVIIIIIVITIITIIIVSSSSYNSYEKIIP